MHAPCSRLLLLSWLSECQKVGQRRVVLISPVFMPTCLLGEHLYQEVTSGSSTGIRLYNAHGFLCHTWDFMSRHKVLYASFYVMQRLCPNCWCIPWTCDVMQTLLGASLMPGPTSDFCPFLSSICCIFAFVLSCSSLPALIILWPSSELHLRDSGPFSVDGVPSPWL